MSNKKIAFCLLIILQACANGADQKQTQKDSIISSQKITAISTIPSSTKTLNFKNEEGTSGQATNEIKVGEIICYIPGRFNYLGKNDTAYIIKTKQGEGNPVEDGKPDEYAVKFTSTTLTINIGCCDARLINEGDLNNDGKDELSIFQYPENGNTCYFKTYTDIKGEWKELFEPFLISAAGEPITDEELQGKVVKDKEGIYYYDNVDTSDEIISVKKKVILK